MAEKDREEELLAPKWAFCGEHGYLAAATAAKSAEAQRINELQGFGSFVSELRVLDSGKAWVV